MVSASAPSAVIPAAILYCSDGSRARLLLHLSVLLGLPATSFPVGRTKATNLPVGLQAMGAKNNDFFVLDVVENLMKELGTDKFCPPAGFK